MAKKNPYDLTLDPDEIQPPNAPGVGLEKFIRYLAQARRGLMTSDHAWAYGMDALLHEAEKSVTTHADIREGLQAPFGQRVIIEGIDGIGKSTIRDIVRRKMEHRPHVDERWVGTCYVYDRLFNRNPKRQYVFEVLQQSVYYDLRQVVLCCTDCKGLRRRLMAMGEFDHTLSNLVWADTYYKEWYEFWTKRNPRKTLLVTVDMDSSPLDVAEGIAKWLRA